MTTSTSSSASAAAPQFSLAGTFLEGVASRDFAHLASALEPETHMRALLPRGLVEVDGADEVKAIFERFFGQAEQFELVDAVVGEVGTRLQLRWRVRLQAPHLGEGWFVVEQQVYADADPGRRIRNLSLLCSGYCPERGDADINP